LYWIEVLIAALCEEYGKKMSENITLRKSTCVYGSNVQKVTGSWEELNIEELYNFTIYKS
jgi:hypothetical protein